eukprot:GHVO01009809.1.p1 GENE.GHVO01009809.1~~GHVO01009809.1.p1  ORF type:complete len:531 (+),score=75.00 GHVO01009809.1:65-1594(+)
MYEKQHNLLVQILSLLINVTFADCDETADLPEITEELVTWETIMRPDNGPNEESLKFLTTITSKLKSRPHDILEPLREKSNTAQKLREASQVTAPKESETAANESETAGDLPPDYQQVSGTETEGAPSSASFSIIPPSTVVSEIDQYQDEFAELKTKLADPVFTPSEKVQSVFDIFELVLLGRQPTQANEQFTELPHRFSEVLQTIEELEEESKALNVAKENLCEELKQLKERPVSMGIVQGQQADSSWVDLSHEAEPALNFDSAETQRLRNENEHKDSVIVKLRGHMNELTKANIAWDKKYESMKQEFSTKILKLKNAHKLSSKKVERLEKADYLLIGPDEVTADEERRKIRDLEAKLRTKSKEQETELNLLRQQVRIFKDDFATERNEHKKLWRKHQKLTENFQEARKKIHDTSSKLAKTQKELATEKREKERLQASVLRSHEQPPLSNLTDDRNEVWKCQYCTFDNISERIACEMCGKRDSSHPSEQLAPLMSRVARSKPPPAFDP